METALLIGVVGCILYTLWVILEDVFGLIDQWHARARESAEDMSTNMEREH